jgi:hypothetical protein
MSNRNLGQRIRRVFLWTMVVSFCLAAAAGIMVLLGISFDETGAQVLATTVTVGLFSLAMLCCGAVFTRPSRILGVVGVLISLLTLCWSIFMIWSDWAPEWNTFQVLLSGITLTVAFSFASLVLASTTHRDRLIQTLIWSCLALISASVFLTLLLIWEAWWESESFPRVYGIALILAVLCGVVAPLLSSLRKRRGPAELERQSAAYVMEPSAPIDHGTLDPSLVAALEQEAAARGITAAQLVAPLLQGPR